MTGDTIMALSMGLCCDNSQGSSETRGFALQQLSILLAEVFAANESLRQSSGKGPLGSIPTLRKLEDEVPYEDSLCRAVLPYGLAAKLVLDDGDMGKMTYFQSQYVNALNDITRALPADVIDLY